MYKEKFRSLNTLPKNFATRYTTRRNVDAQAWCPHCGWVKPIPYLLEDDAAAVGDRCPSCGYDFWGWCDEAIFNGPAY